MLRYKLSITFNADIQYPYIDTKKDIRSLERDFNIWVKNWANSSSKDETTFVPTLYEFKTSDGSSVEHQPNAKVNIKVVKDKETILETSWEELSDDF